jgi:hypothetical protein
MIDVLGERQWLPFELAVVAAGPGVVEPVDYDAVDNDRRWRGAVGPTALGIEFIGPYDNLVAYVFGNVVSSGGESFIAIAPTTGHPPTAGSDNAWWALLAKKGVDGADGADSTVPGPAGTPGSVVRNSASVPSNALGIDGDYYLRSTTKELYFKAAGAYSVIAVLSGTNGTNGTNGAAGTPGSIIRNGSSVPSNALGIDGDYYVRSTTKDFYFKAAGAYSIIAVLSGTNGTNGTNGAAGTNGVNGNTVLNGVVAPDVGVGVNGDFYINTATTEIYGPKTAGAWGSPTSLVGSGGGGLSAVPEGSTDTLAYVSDGDANGVFHLLGTNFGAVAWENPITAGRLVGFFNHHGGGAEADAYSDRTNAGTPPYTSNAAGTHVLFDFGAEHSLVVDKYSVQLAGAPERAIRNFTLKGSNDVATNDDAGIAAATWENIDVRVADTTMPTSADAWGTYVANQSNLSDYRWLLLTHDGLNAAGDNYFNLGELEFYGAFTHGRVYTPGQLAVFQDSSTLEPSALTGVLKTAGGVPEVIVPDPAWDATSVTETKTFDADTVTTPELADVLGTLIARLKADGVI